MTPWITRLIIALLVLGLAGVPEAFAQAAQQQPAPQQTTDSQTAKPAQPATVMPDPAAGPLAPIPSDQQDVPNAPSAARQPQPPAAQAPPQTAPQTRQEQPLGAAAAEASKTSGGLASKPAGTAIAPAKQRQVRSLLIKVGAVLAGGAALGAIYGLTRGTSSVPPHASAASTATR